MRSTGCAIGAACFAAATLAAGAVSAEETVTSVPIAAAPPAAPSPDESSSDPSKGWYGHWLLLTGTASAAAYTLAVYGVWQAFDGGDGDDAGVAGAVGTGYLLALGHVFPGALIHGLHDNAAAAVVSGLSRLVLGVAGPAIGAALCPRGEGCTAAFVGSSAAGAFLPVIIDGLIAWD